MAAKRPVNKFRGYLSFYDQKNKNVLLEIDQKLFILMHYTYKSDLTFYSQNVARKSMLFLWEYVSLNRN